MYPHWFDFNTHCAVFGGTQYGKSSWTEDCTDDHIDERNGVTHFCFDRPHFARLVDKYIYRNPDQRIIPLDFTQAETIVPLGHWLWRDPPRNANAIAGAWGARNLDQLASYSRIMKTLLAWCAEAKQPIQNAASLVKSKNPTLLKRAIDMATNSDTRDELAGWDSISPTHWNSEFKAVQNRLYEFSGSPSLKAFFGTPGTLDIRRSVSDRDVILALFPPGEAGKIAAGLLLSEFFEAEGKYFLYLDEAASYLPHDGAILLDQAAKRGTRATLIFHHLQQFDDPHLTKSILVNCGIKVATGGLPAEDRQRLVPEFFLPQLGEPWEKHRFENYITEYMERGYESTTITESEYSSSQSIKYDSRFVPEQHLVTTGIMEYSEQEKITILAREFELPPGQILVKLPDGTELLEFPKPQPYWISSEQRLQFEAKHSYGIPAEPIPNLQGHDHASDAANRTRKRPRRKLSPEK